MATRGGVAYLFVDFVKTFHRGPVRHLGQRLDRHPDLILGPGPCRISAPIAYRSVFVTQILYPSGCIYRGPLRSSDPVLAVLFYLLRAYFSPPFFGCCFFYHHQVVCLRLNIIHFISIYHARNLQFKFLHKFNHLNWKRLCNSAEIRKTSKSMFEKFRNKNLQKLNRLMLTHQIFKKII